MNNLVKGNGFREDWEFFTGDVFEKSKFFLIKTREHKKSKKHTFFKELNRVEGG